MNKYLTWLSKDTETDWWHDSAVMAELKLAMSNGAVGATTNPPLCCQALYGSPEAWREKLAPYKDLKGDEKAERIIREITTEVAAELYPIYESTGGAKGYACAQVNPAFQGNAQKMLENAHRIAEWAPNMSVKLPASRAGIQALEELIAEGICVTSTVSFTVPQVLAAARAHLAGVKRAKEAGRKPGLCNAVIMVGRVDDYLRDIVADSGAQVSEEDLHWAGIACIRRARGLLDQEGLRIMPAAFRGSYHIRELAGKDLILSTAAGPAKLVEDWEPPFTGGMGDPVPEDSLRRLLTVSEFCRAYEPDGMAETEFISSGMFQRTISQFTEAWNRIAAFPI